MKLYFSRTSRRIIFQNQDTCVTGYLVNDKVVKVYEAPISMELMREFGTNSHIMDWREKDVSIESFFYQDQNAANVL